MTGGFANGLCSNPVRTADACKGENEERSYECPKPAVGGQSGLRPQTWRGVYIALTNDHLRLAIPTASRQAHRHRSTKQRPSPANIPNIAAPARFPTFHVFRALLPLFRWRRDRMSSVIPLLAHFDRHGYLSPEPLGHDRTFQTVSLEEHLERLLG